MPNTKIIVFPLLDLPRELILLVASFLDQDDLLRFRRTSKLLERITYSLFFNVANNKIVSDTIACGEASVILVRQNQIWCWGDNYFNQLAFGDYSCTYELQSCFSPKKGSLKNVIKVVMGDQFSLAITKDRTVFSSGSNGYGELGLGDRKKRIAPQVIPDLTKVTQIAAGNKFALAVTEDGTLYSWGKNDCGQLGHGHKTDCTAPKVVSGITNVSQIAVGGAFSVALTKNGMLYIWGRLGGTSDECLLVPKFVTTLLDVASISAGKNFILALKNDGKVFTWGCDQGQLGDGIKVPNLENIVEISVNNYLFNFDCLALSKEGTVYFWDHLDVWTKTGNQPQKIIGLEKIVEIGLGFEFIVALDKDGILYSLGTNKDGQLGIGKGHVQCDTPTKAWSFGEPVRTKFFNSVTKRLVNEKFANTSLTSEQKAKIVEQTEAEVFSQMIKRS